jgi:RNA polymerase sigma-70 factor (ECF subfamily)
MIGNLSACLGRGATDEAGAYATDEVRLVERLRAGDGQAFELLVRQFGGQMLAVARRYLKCEADCADAVQDAFVSAFRGMGAFEASSSLATWLHRIVVNACLMKLRAKSRRRTAPLDDLLPAFDETGHHAAPIKPWTDEAYQRLASAETRAEVRACIDRLPDGYRTVLLLRDIDEFDTEQTANVLGISPAAVKTRLHRARQGLRTLLEPVFGAERKSSPRPT